MRFVGSGCCFNCVYFKTRLSFYTVNFSQTYWSTKALTILLQQTCEIEHHFIPLIMPLLVSPETAVVTEILISLSLLHISIDDC